MSRRQGGRRRGRASVGRLFGSLRSALGAVVTHPLRAGLLGLAGTLLAWLVLTRSLPDALVDTNPDLALILSPDHPGALITKAEGLRSRLLELTVKANVKDLPPAVASKTRLQHNADNVATGVGRHAAPNIAPVIAADPQTLAAERNALRVEIGGLARRVIRHDPLNARAFRLLAEVTDDVEQVRALMQAAAKRSRRESIAIFWLLNDSFVAKDFARALDHADILLRTRGQLTPYVMSYLGSIAEDPLGRPLIIQRLAAAPSWRRGFFSELPRNVRDPRTPLELMIALKDAGKPVAQSELGPYLAFLIGNNLVEQAYNSWLQLLPKEQLAGLGLLTNASFELDPSGLPFDWVIARPLNAVVELAAAREASGARALHIGFGTGRIRFPETSQVVMLAPGRYRLEGKLRGTIIAKRGLRWQLRCIYGTKRMLAETDMLLGQFPGWRTFDFEVEVPDNGDCRAQTLRLFHDSRSASEELITGDIWFDDLRLARLPD